MKFRCRTIKFSTYSSLERQGKQDKVLIERQKFELDSIRFHCIDIPHRQVLFHLLRWLLIGIVAGGVSIIILCNYFLLRVFGPEDNWGTPVPYVIIWTTLFMVIFFFVIFGYLRFKAPLDAAIKERSRLEKLEHSKLKAVPERRWKHFIKILGDKTELVKKTVITDSITMKKIVGWGLPHRSYSPRPYLLMLVTFNN
jgi:hypothetical protein